MSLLNLPPDTSLGPFRAETTEGHAALLRAVGTETTARRGDEGPVAAEAGPFPRCCLRSALMSEDLPTLGIPITMAQ